MASPHVLVVLYTSYDRANRLLQVTDGVNTTTYAYDGLGNRISQDVNGLLTRYLLDLQPGLTVVLSATENTNITRYVHSLRGIHAHKDAGGAWEWMVQDGLGSVRSVTDDALNVLWSGNPEPFGKYFGESGTRQTNYGFTGEYTDLVSELLYLRARYYNPAIGVFTALDPFEGKTCRPMSLNGYSWVEGNMPNGVDPTGMFLESPALWNACYGNLPIFQPQGNIVHIACGQQAFARSQPSTSGTYVTTYFAGMEFTKYDERVDSPTAGGASSSYVLISPPGQAPQWIRRQDGNGNTIVLDGPATPCDIPIPTPITPPSPSPFSFVPPGCSRGGTCITSCFDGPNLKTLPTSGEGNTPTVCSQEYVVAFILACESGSEQFAPGSPQQLQAMTDIAHVIRSRVKSSAFPNTAFDVVRAGGQVGNQLFGQFQCFREGSNANLDVPIGLAYGLAYELVHDKSLPDASIPEVTSDYALYFYGTQLGPERANAPANSIPVSNVITFLTSNGFVGVGQNVLSGGALGKGIYLGHGPVSPNSFVSVFFSDDPHFPGS